MIAVAATVFFVWLALARDKGWAWILAALFGFQAAQNVFGGGGSLFFPVLVIATGVVLLSRGHLSRQAIIAILVILAVVGIAADDHSHHNGPKQVEAGETTVTGDDEPERTQLPELKGRRLVVAANNADVAISKSRGGRVTVSDDDAEFEVSEPDGIVLIELGDLGGALDLQVPAEARVVVKTNSGDVEAEVEGFGLDVDTVSGHVELEIAGDYPVKAETLSGRISSDELDDEDPSAAKLVVSGTGMPVTINTVAGDIRIEQD